MVRIIGNYRGIHKKDLTTFTGSFASNVLVYEIQPKRLASGTCTWTFGDYPLLPNVPETFWLRASHFLHVWETGMFGTGTFGAATFL